MQTTTACVPATLRPARPDEASRLIKFYEDANDPDVLPRPEGDFRRAAERGAFFVIESDGELIACSGVFEIDPDVHSHQEAGATYVVPRFRGCSLQSTLIEARVATSVVNLDGTTLVIGVKPTNKKSLGNVVAAGFSLWATPIPSLLAACATCTSKPSLVARDCCCDFYTLNERQAKVAVGRLLTKLPSYQTEPRPADGLVLNVSFIGVLFENPEHRDTLDDFVSR